MSIRRICVVLLLTATFAPVMFAQLPGRTVEQKQALFFRHLFMTIANVDQSQQELDHMQRLIADKYDFDTQERSALRSTAIEFRNSLMRIKSATEALASTLASSQQVTEFQATIKPLIAMRDDAVSQLSSKLVAQLRPATVARLRAAATAN